MKRFAAAVGVLVFVPLLGVGSFAEESYRKFRITLNVSDQDTADSIRTNAENTSRTENVVNGQVISVDTIDDPRPDEAVENELTISNAARIDLGVSYGLFKWKWGELTLDASAGYFEGDVGDLEVAGEFSLATGGGVDPPRVACGEISRFHLFYIPVGEVEEYPVRVGGTLRFRTRAQGGPIRAMSPYVGLGVGYMFVTLNPHEDFIQFSENVQNSSGFYQYATGNGGAAGSRPHQFKAAEASAPDSFTYHVHGGLEFPFGKGWSLFFNGGYMWATEEIQITVDGRENFGTAIPNGDSDLKYPERGLPVVFLSGGLVDYSSGTPTPIEGQPCKFQVGPKDGVIDGGNYYVLGGTVRYDGLSIGLGVRYQF